MKVKIIFVLMVAWVSFSTHGQGTILFNNRVTGQVDAPFSMPDGRGVGMYDSPVHAQLYLVSGPGAGDVYTPLFPSTTFRTTSSAASFYLTQPAAPVVVPGVPAGSEATVLMRIWTEAPTYEEAFPNNRGQSNPVTITLGGVPPGGGAPIPDAVLVGLHGGFAVPEPSTMSLALLGGAVLLCRRRGE